MTEHFTKNVESVTHWCNRCKRLTQFAVTGGRLGRCLEHAAATESKRQKREREKRAHEAANPRLFPIL
jgi:hypothetical protein